ncbi:MAG: hypothetical protein NUW37_13730 [Planctomycetes bacterium]|nr:hypothetical protein [Planctomycetota bacterium]
MKLRDSGLTLTEYGEWYYGEVLATNEAIVEALNRGIERDDHGNFLVSFERFRGKIHVARTAFLVLGFSWNDGSDSPTIELITGEKEPLRTDTLRVDETNRLWAKSADGRDFLFSYSAFWSFVNYLDEDEIGYKLVRGGTEIRLIINN